jgi:signal transduction histidine kinase
VKRFLPQTLAGQMISLLLLALVASQALSFWFFFDERRMAVRAAARGHIFARTASIVRLLAETPPRLHRQILDAVSNPRQRFWVSDSAEAEDDDEDDDRDDRSALLTERLRSALDDPRINIVVELNDDVDDDDSRGRIANPLRWRLPHERHKGAFRRPRDDRPRHSSPPHRSNHRHRFGLTLSLQLPDKQWLNAQTTFQTPPLTWAVPSMAAMAVMALALVVIVTVMVRRLTGPMTRLAVAADKFGRGAHIDPLRVEGPRDIRRTTRAFNRMRERLQRFVQDRTQMLAAISHDLRTPLTALRLRAEFITDAETKEKMLATIDEMNAMVEAILAFAREDAAQEDTRTVDLNALVESVCADFSDLGNDVTFTPGERVPYACRPFGLKRALRNVIENAMRYAGNARVSIAREDQDHHIIVEDDGPGVPDAEMERVFEPFMRLETSRNQESGGIGLGLSIVRSIFRSHGGDVILENREEGGLRVSMTLPRNEPAN